MSEAAHEQLHRDFIDALVTDKTGLPLTVGGPDTDGWHPLLLADVAIAHLPSDSLSNPRKLLNALPERLRVDDMTCNFRLRLIEELSCRLRVHQEVLLTMACVSEGIPLSSVPSEDTVELLIDDVRLRNEFIWAIDDISAARLARKL